MARSVDSDVLVIGTGGSGLRAAIEAKERNVGVTIVSKSPAGMNNATVVSGGGFRAAIEGLTVDEHYRDTIEVGKRLNDPKLTKIFAEEGGERVLELKRFGVEMRIHQGGVSVGTIPTLMGLGITKPLVEHCRSIGVEVLENIVVTKLLKKGDAIVGAVGYDVHVGEPVIFSSKIVILATGGAGALYKRTDCPLRMTGDGYSLGLNAGARLRDMEFVQFFPIALAEPGVPYFLLGGAITEEGHILNTLGEDIPKKYGLTARPLVLKSRDLLSRVMMMEIAQGSGISGAVLIDAREVFVRRSVENLASTGPVKYLLEKLKASEKPFKVAPICHFCMGGLVIDENGYTSIPGLYAAGEVVGGVHGANRHGGNALTDIIVFGARAGASAAIRSKKIKAKRVEELAMSEIGRYELLKARDNGYNPYIIMERLREVMWDKAGIIRDSVSLSEAFGEIFELRGMAEKVIASKERDMLTALEVPMALDAAEMIVRAAMERRESRGAHYRSDYPLEDPKWLKPIILSRTNTDAIRLTV